jgi:hypothetical protein
MYRGNSASRPAVPGKAIAAPMGPRNSAGSAAPARRHARPPVPQQVQRLATQTGGHRGGQRVVKPARAAAPPD